MDFVKSLEKFFKSQAFFIIVVLIILFVAFNYYSNNKSKSVSGLNNLNVSQPGSVGPSTATIVPGQVNGYTEQTPDLNGSPITGITTTNNQGGSCTSKQISNPADLLPRDTNSEWAQLNPNGTGDLQNVSLLKAGQHYGVNTVGSSLRNANLQIRSEPPIQKSNVGPWLNSTIEPDCLRKSLELGPSTC